MELSQNTKILLGIGLLIYSVIVFKVGHSVGYESAKTKVKEAKSLDATESIRCTEVLNGNYEYEQE